MSPLAPEPLPVFAPGVRLRWDSVRGQWQLQAPEKIVVADETAAEVLRLLDGRRTLDDLLTALAARYDAEPQRLREDVLCLLAELKAAGLLR